jgi:Met-10+ like-protein
MPKGVFYEREELEIIATHFKGGTFVDIGANVGNHSIFAAKFLGASKVIAFEPNPTAYVIFKWQYRVKRPREPDRASRCRSFGRDIPYIASHSC